MSYPYYSGEPLQQAESVNLPDTTVYSEQRPQTYLPDDGLVAAVNIALMLGRPLLLTGEPGCGKTQLAYHLAWKLGLGEPLRFDTKSTSNARDLFYTYDAISHFHAAQIHKDGNPEALPHITPDALGIAILLTQPSELLENQGLLGLLENADIMHSEPRRSVVLIDEIDKAPRDFPNDILNEVEKLYFHIPELGKKGRIQANLKHRPILILTSNSEKHLPDAFLRRCVYYNIPFPDKSRLQVIVDAHLEKLAKDHQARFQEALAFFLKLRESASKLGKKPATAEFLNWLLVLPEMCDKQKPLTQQVEKVAETFSGLVKKAEDQEAIGVLWKKHCGLTVDVQR